YAFTSYAANYQVFGTPADYGVNPSNLYGMQASPSFSNTFRDGLSTTILFAEKSSKCLTYFTLWGYQATGNWDHLYMPMFAYGDPVTQTGYFSPGDTVNPGAVGDPGGMFQARGQFDPYNVNCLPNRTQTPHS